MPARYPYKPLSHVVEVHIARPDKPCADVYHHDYGRDEEPAIRAIDRLLQRLDYSTIREIRHWHAGSLLSKWEAKHDSETADAEAHAASLEDGHAPFAE